MKISISLLCILLDNTLCFIFFLFLCCKVFASISTFWNGQFSFLPVCSTFKVEGSLRKLDTQRFEIYHNCYIYNLEYKQYLCFLHFHCAFNRNLPQTDLGNTIEIWLNLICPINIRNQEVVLSVKRKSEQLNIFLKILLVQTTGKQSLHWVKQTQ